MKKQNSCVCLFVLTRDQLTVPPDLTLSSLATGRAVLRLLPRCMSLDYLCRFKTDPGLAVLVSREVKTVSTNHKTLSTNHLRQNKS